MSLRKKELVKYIEQIRPKADAYNRVCKAFNIENDIISYTKRLSPPNGSKPEMPLQVKHKLEEALSYYNDKLINHRSGMMLLIDQAVGDYEENVKYLKKLLGLT